MSASEPPPPGGGGAPYWELVAELDPAAEELWSWFCFQRGATGAEWREETPARLRIAYFFDQLRERDPERWRADFAAVFPAASPPGRVAIAERPREPWATAWHAHFAPEPVAGRFLVCPPWAVPSAPGEGPHAGRIPLVIEPGQGFGTGKHATTALVLALLEDLAGGWTGAGAVPGWIVDVGTGSGILAIAARLLGVPRAVTVDIDGAVMPEVARNFRHNGLNPPLRVRGGAECLRGRFPLVVANLVMPLLAQVAPHLARLTAPGGTLIVSGLLEGEGEALRPHCESRGLRLAASRAREGWLACRFARPSHRK